MSVAELKNNLHQMALETEDPEILVQIAALFAFLLGEGDWLDSLSNEEKKGTFSFLIPVKKSLLIRSTQPNSWPFFCSSYQCEMR